MRQLWLKPRGHPYSMVHSARCPFHHRAVGPHHGRPADRLRGWWPRGFIAAGLLVLAACAGQDRPPQLQRDGQFEYPGAARAAGIEGFAVVAFALTADGRVEEARIVAAKPAGVFDAAALRYVRARRYQPLRRDGQPVAVAEMQVRVNFVLGDTAYP